MTSWTAPTEAEIDAAVARLARPELISYFFRNLKNPLWLAPLRRRKFFDDPPPPKEIEGGWISPPWPQLDYLLRVADQAPEEAAAVIKKTETENWTVQFGLIEASLKLPSSLSKELVTKFNQWTRGKFFHPLMFENLAKLASVLGKGGEIRAAIDLAKRLLALERPPQKDDDLFSSQAIARIDNWHYNEVLKILSAGLVDQDEYTSLLSTLLAKSIEFGSPRVRRTAEDGKVDDFSNWWRPAIEDHAQNGTGDIRDILVAHLRDAYSARLADGSLALDAAWGKLLERKYSVFHRIALYLLIHTDTPPHALVREAILDHGWENSTVVHHEYFHLLKRHFSLLSQEEQNEAFTRIHEYVGSLSEEDHPEWRELRKLYPLQDHLSGEQRARFEALHSKLGDLDHPDFLSYSTFGWVGESSPKPAKDLLALSNSELVSFLLSWRPDSESRGGPSLRGLADDLGQAVKQDPGRFVESALLFEALEPSLGAGFVDGLINVIKETGSIDWTKLLEYASAVVRRYVANEDGEYLLRRLLSMLTLGLNSGDTEMGIAHRDDAWTIIAQLCAHPDPIYVPKESSYEGGIGLANEAINTVRGEALHGAVRYGLWVRRSAERSGDSEALLRGLAEMPELQTVLDEHLDPAIDPSPVTRSVYGQWLPWLQLLDPQWLRDRIAKLLPQDETDAIYRAAVWDTYLLYCPAYSAMHGVLRDQYLLAVDELRGLPAIRPKSAQQTHDHLAEHVASYYWRGFEDLSGESLVTRFFVSAPDWLKERFVEFIGRSIRNSEEQIPEDIAARLRAFWDWRLEAIAHEETTTSVRGELEGFAWWIGESTVSDEWTARALQRTTSLLPTVSHDFMFALDGMQRLATSYPGEIAHTLNNLVTKDAMGWYTGSWVDKIAEIMRVIVASSNQDARKTVVRTAELLGRKNFLQFREFAVQ